MSTPYEDAAQPDSTAAQLKQCVRCGGITVVPLYEEGGVCDCCGAALPWHPIELY
jgi:hypothetical protein